MSEKLKSVEQLERALWSSCMGSMGMCAGWRNQALAFIQQGGTEQDFILHAHVSSRRKAKAAFALVRAELAINGLKQAALT